DAGWARDFAVLQGEKTQTILCVLQGFSTQQAGKRPAQTVSNGYEYGFLDGVYVFNACRRYLKWFCKKILKILWGIYMAGRGLTGRRFFLILYTIEDKIAGAMKVQCGAADAA
ncbi:MAG: hypothetical protein HFG24_07575, partial [Anaerotruncus sp.]|nr:hypothetical protein [Anaerotruncus sp.]